MPVIPFDRVVGTKKNDQKKWRAEEEERHKGSLTRVTRLGEFSPFGRLFKNSLSIPVFGLCTFSQTK
jgi:hypothetical protein